MATSFGRDPVPLPPSRRYSLSRIPSVPNTDRSDSPSIYSTRNHHDNDHHSFGAQGDDEEREDQDRFNDLLFDSPSLGTASGNVTASNSPDLSRLSMSMYGPKMRKMGVAPWEADEDEDQTEPGGKNQSKRKDKKARERSKTSAGATIAASPAKDYSVLKGLGFGMGSTTSVQTPPVNDTRARRPSVASSSAASMHKSSKITSAVISTASSILTPRLRARTISAGTESIQSVTTTSSYTSFAPLPPPLPIPASQFQAMRAAPSRRLPSLEDPPKSPTSPAYSVTSFASRSSRLQPEDMFASREEFKSSRSPARGRYRQHAHPYANPENMPVTYSVVSDDSFLGHLTPSPRSETIQGLPDVDVSEYGVSSHGKAGEIPATAPLKLTRKKAPPPPLALSIPRSESSVTLTPSLVTSSSVSSSTNSFSDIRTSPGDHRGSTADDEDESSDEDDALPARQHPYAASESTTPVRSYFPTALSPGQPSRSLLSPHMPSSEACLSPHNRALPPSPAATTFSANYSPFLSPSPAQQNTSVHSSPARASTPPASLSPLSPLPHPPTISADGVPRGMLSFPGSPAFNLISLEQAQAKVRAKLQGDGKSGSGSQEGPPEGFAMTSTGSRPSLPILGGLAGGIGSRNRSVSAGGLGLTNSVVSSDSTRQPGKTFTTWDEEGGYEEFSGERLRTRTTTETGPGKSKAGCKTTEMPGAWMPSQKPNDNSPYQSFQAGQSTVSLVSAESEHSNSHALPVAYAPAPGRTLRQRKSGFLKFFNMDGGRDHGQSSRGAGPSHAIISSPIESSLNRLPTPKLPQGYQLPNQSSPSLLSPNPSLMTERLPNSSASSIKFPTRPHDSFVIPAVPPLPIRAQATPRKVSSGTSPSLSHESKMENAKDQGTPMNTSRSHVQLDGSGRGGDTRFDQRATATASPVVKELKPTASQDDHLLRLRPMSTAFMSGLPAELLLSADSSPEPIFSTTASTYSRVPVSSGRIVHPPITPSTPSVSSIASLATTTSSFSTSTSSGSWSPLPTPGSASTTASNSSSSWLGPHSFSQQQQHEKQGGNGAFPSIPEADDPTAVIQDLREQLSSVRKLHSLQVWELEGQIKDLKTEVEEWKAKAGARFSHEQSRSVPGESVGSAEATTVHVPTDYPVPALGGVVHRSRARTGAGARFGNGRE